MTDLLFSTKNENKKIKNKEIKRVNFWTEEEDKILLEKAKEFNYKNYFPKIIFKNNKMKLKYIYS